MIELITMSASMLAPDLKNRLAHNDLDIIDGLSEKISTPEMSKFHLGTGKDLPEGEFEPITAATRSVMPKADPTKPGAYKPKANEEKITNTISGR